MKTTFLLGLVVLCASVKAHPGIFNQSSAANLQTDWARVVNLIQNVQDAVKNSAASISAVATDDNPTVGRDIQAIMNTMDQQGQRILVDTMALAQLRSLYLQIFDAHHKRLQTVISNAERDLRTPLNKLSSSARTTIRDILTLMKSETDSYAMSIILQLPLAP